MKKQLILSFMLSLTVLLYSMPAHSQEKQDNKLIPSCTLSSEEMMERAEQLRATIFKKIVSVNELRDGYDFTFNEPGEFASQLVDFINFERSCCRYFTFALEFEPDKGPIHLQVKGSKEIKKELEFMLKELSLLQ